MKNDSTPKCNHECDLINWDTCNYQCPNCGALIRKYDWLNEKLKNNSTPKEEQVKKLKKTKIEIGFNEQSTHEDIVQQVVDKLWLADFASKEEIIEHLKIADILYKNNGFHAEKHKRGKK